MLKLSMDKSQRDRDHKPLPGLMVFEEGEGGDGDPLWSMDLILAIYDSTVFILNKTGVIDIPYSSYLAYWRGDPTCVKIMLTCKPPDA